MRKSRSDGRIVESESEILKPKSKIVMMLYVLIGLSLSLLGVAGLQFFYLIYLERIDREQKKRIHELERHCKFLSTRVAEAETEITKQNNLLESIFDEFGEEEEIWADVIEDR